MLQKRKKKYTSVQLCFKVYVNNDMKDYTEIDQIKSIVISMYSQLQAKSVEKKPRDAEESFGFGSYNIMYDRSK
jgi:hypothetical protein